MEQLLQRHGYDLSKVIYQVNNVYLGTESVEILIGVATIFVFLILVGYLLIYNIFHIRIVLDTQYYALLAMLGMDKSQLGKVIKAEATILIIIGAPLGILCGKFCAWLLVPLAAKILSFEIFVESSVSWWVFLLIFIFTGITVYISCKKPMNIVQRMSLISGVEYQGNIKRTKSKSDTQLQISKMAWWNILREKGKLWTVILAISFAVILFNSMYSIVDGFNLNKYLEERIDSDYVVTDESIVNLELEKNLDCVPKELSDYIKSIEGIENLKYTYMSEGNVILDSMCKIRVEEMCGDEQKYFIKTDNGNTFISGQIYGLEEQDAKNIVIKDGEWDAEKFKSGNYVIVNTSLTDEYFYYPGEQVTIEYPNGTEKSYEVLAIGEIPNSVSAKYWTDLGCRLILPIGEYINCTENTAAMLLRFDINDNVKDFDESSLQQIIEENELMFLSRNDYIEEFSDFKNAYLLIGSVLAGVIALIGLINFANTIITSINYRERELTLLNIIGMTDGQCIRLLLWESGYYAILSIIFTDTVGLAVSYGLVKIISSMFEFIDWKFDVSILLGGNIVFLLVSYLSTMLTYGILKKRNLGMRLQRFNL